MFGLLTKRFQDIFSLLKSKKILTEENISDALRQIRLALLDADVNYTVAKKLILQIKEKALGQKVIKHVSPGDQFTKIVHDELVSLMGREEAQLIIERHPAIIVLCGLQGSGKTTQAAKLAHFLKEKRKKVLLAACDLQRPAAIDQLEKLALQIETSIYLDRREKNAEVIARAALERAEKEAFDVLIIDTAGRLHIDDQLMKELEKLVKAVKPHEILFVANAAMGQDAVNAAKDFNERLDITGIILTMLDGNTRAGAAISIREVTGRPLKFEGIGEKVEDLQIFNPHSMADRILGMGDIINLVKKTKQHFDQEESKKIQKKLRKASFSFDDFLKQMRLMKKMGSFKSLLQMLPGFSTLGDLDIPEQEMKRMEATILSMTPKERCGLEELSHLHRQRIAKGSGNTLAFVNQMLKRFKQAKKIMKHMPGLKGGLEEKTMPENSLTSIEDLKKGLPKHFR